MTRDIDSILDELEYALAEADAYNVKGVFENEQELRRLAERTDLDPADLLKRASVLTHMPISPVWLSPLAIGHLLLLERKLRAREKLPAVFYDRPSHRPPNVAANNRLARAVDDLREQEVPYARMVSAAGEPENELQKKGFPRRECEKTLKSDHKEWQQSLDGYVYALEKRYNGGKPIIEEVVAERIASDRAALTKLGH